MGARQRLIGVFLLFGGALMVALGLWIAAVSLFLLGGFFFVVGGFQRTAADAIPLLNTAHNAALEGRVADAERALDEAEQRFHAPFILRVIDLQRAGIALRRAELEVARARLDTAVARPVGLLTRAEDRVKVGAARAMRALVLAMMRDAEGARADIEIVRADPLAPAESLARAAVAEAMLIERAGDRDALAAHLDRERRLLFDHTAPRERAVMRAYQRMLAAPRNSVYRRAAEPDREEERSDEPRVADWVAKVAPAAAPFARSRRAPAAEGAPPEVAPAPLPPGLVRVAEDRLQGKGTSAGPKAGKVLALWVALVAAFGGVWALLSGDPEGRADLEAVLPSVPVGVGLLVSGILGLALVAMALLVRRNLRITRRLSAALGLLARGREEEAEAELLSISKAPFPLVAAQACRELARLSERRADFAEALARCDRGIAAATSQPGTLAVAAVMVLPDLVAERALLLAATDLHDKARAEMTVLEGSFPAYPFHAVAELRVALVSRARRGELAAAARVAEAHREDVPLPERDETLADLVRAAVSPASAGAGELPRLARDLRRDPHLRAWIDAVAPDLLARFHHAREGSAEDLRDLEAEREQEAAEEAMEGEGSIVRA